MNRDGSQVLSSLAFPQRYYIGEDRKENASVKIEASDARMASEKKQKSKNTLSAEYLSAWGILRGKDIPPDILLRHFAPMVLSSFLIGRYLIRMYAHKIVCTQDACLMDTGLHNFKAELSKHRFTSVAPLIAKEALSVDGLPVRLVELILSPTVLRHRAAAVLITQLLIEMAENVEKLADQGIASALCTFLQVDNKKNQPLFLHDKKEHILISNTKEFDHTIHVALTALAGIASKSTLHRDQVLKAGGAAAVLSQLEYCTSRTLRPAALALATLCRGSEPPPQYSLLKSILPVLNDFLHLSPDNYDQVVAFACEALSCLCDRPEDTNTPSPVQDIVEIPNLCLRLVQLMPNSEITASRAISESALTCLGNIAASRYCQVLVSVAALPKLSLLLQQSQDTDLRRYACCAVANLLASGLRDDVFDEHIIIPLVHILANEQEAPSLRLEASYALANATVNASPYHIAILIDAGFLSPFLEWCLLDYRTTTSLSSDCTSYQASRQENYSHLHFNNQEQDSLANSATSTTPLHDDRNTAYHAVHPAERMLLLNGLEALRNIFIGLGLDGDIAAIQLSLHENKRRRFFTVFQQTEDMISMLEFFCRNHNQNFHLAILANDILEYFLNLTDVLLSS